MPSTACGEFREKVLLIRHLINKYGKLCVAVNFGGVGTNWYWFDKYHAYARPVLGLIKALRG